MTPIELLNQWLSEERSAGALNPNHAVLSTATQDAIPHGRVVAIREVDDLGLLFFTQKGTRKVHELTQNPLASLTYWFALQSREVIFEGKVEALSDLENETYWHAYPREAQIRFQSYAPTSSNPILKKELLEEKREQLRAQYKEQKIPYTSLYCGFRVKPIRVVFYTYRPDVLSDVVEYQLYENQWKCQLLSP